MRREPQSRVAGRSRPDQRPRHSPGSAGGAGHGWLLWLSLVVVAGVGASLLIRILGLRMVVAIAFAASFLLLGYLLYFRASDGRWVDASRLLLAIAVLCLSFGSTHILLPEEPGLEFRERVARTALFFPAAIFLGLLAYVALRIPRELREARRRAIAAAREALRAEEEDPGLAEALWLKAERSARRARIDPPTRDHLRLLVARPRDGGPRR